MSQVGSMQEADKTINPRQQYAKVGSEMLRNEISSQILSPEYAENRAVALLIFSVLGLLGNCAVLLTVLSLKRLQKAQNSFLIHQCLLDGIKSAYCIVFSRVRTH